MQYYAQELVSRFQGRARTIAPVSPLKGAKGHMWEQFVLPLRARGGLLWSPNNTGPIASFRQICTIHDLIPLDYPQWFQPDFARWYGWLLPRLARKSAHLIAVSHYTKARAVELLGVSAGKISVVHNGVDKRFAPVSSAAIARTKQELGIRFERYVLIVGSIEPRKNVAGFLRAWPEISRREPDLGLVIAGARGSGLVFGNAGLPEASANVCFTGYVRHELLPALYAGAMALVYPTLAEGFGLPPLEAMACGTPVVTAMNSSLPEVVGDAATGVDPLDPASIAEAVVRLARSETLRNDYRTRGLRRAAQFSWDRCAAETWKVLEAFA